MTRLAARLTLLLTIALVAATARAGDRAGVFDYYVLSLSWQPSWCEATGDQRDADECDDRHDHGWLLHGLWPQYARGGWPEFCRSDRPDPPRSATATMTDVFGSAGLAWHQWKKHGRCSGLTHTDYFDRARQAYERYAPDELQLDHDQAIRLRGEVLEEYLRELVSGIDADDAIVACSGGLIREIRLCLDKELEPRPCADDVLARACNGAARLPPIR